MSGLRKSISVHLTPTRFLVIGFAAVIIVGTILLCLPVASTGGQSIGLIDAFFTATSAVCVTGLVVVDTGTAFTLFGQIIIISLIQIGGLGLMTMSTLVFLLLGKRITLKERLIMQEALNQSALQGVVRLSRNILLLTLIFEGLGAALLALRFIPIFGWSKGIYYSVFHSISAFCNAGFDLMGGYSSLTGFAGDVIVNFSIMGLIISGGMGFTVILDIYSHLAHPRRWSLQTKVVVSASSLLIICGFVFFLAVEYNNPFTLGQYTFGEKALAALFHSVSTRTAGFNTTNMASLTNASKFMTIVLMFIGASPTSTGGGIKTTTFSMILLIAYSVITGREDTVVFGKRVPFNIAGRALAISLISMLILIAVTMALSLAELVPFIDLMFQAASALGTVGLASIDTSSMADISKILLASTMFAGRVGPLTMSAAFARRHLQYGSHLRYPEERIMIG